MGKVVLVGAGPGDAALITVKGMEKIKECDVIIYDRLISEELLKYARKDCIMVDVGKKPGAHTMKQEQINHILVKYGKEYERVVRLKGGDSFVFGRGGEEIAALVEAGIDFELVPGVTSAVAVPEMAGIPVTHRGVARSFHVITGHTMDGKALSNEEFAVYAQLQGTLVFLMGLGSLENIADRLIESGKSAATPVAVIANGTTDREIKLTGTLQDISAKVREREVKSPAIIVVGETAAYSMTPDSIRRRKLPVIGTVGTVDTAGNFRENIDESLVQCKSMIEMQAVETEGVRELEKCMEKGSYDWILFTSRQAVKMFFNIWNEKGRDVRGLAAYRFGAVGKGTAEALRNYGIISDFTAGQSDSSGMAEEFISLYGGEKKHANRRVLIPCAARSSGILQDKLKNAGFHISDIRIYDVSCKDTDYQVRPDEVDGVAVFSSSAAESFFDVWNEYYSKNPPKGIIDLKVYVLGNMTAQSISNIKSDYIRPRVVVAESQTMESLAQAVMRDCRKGMVL